MHYKHFFRPKSQIPLRAFDLVCSGRCTRQTEE
jgi:hypothetical protein